MGWGVPGRAVLGPHEWNGWVWCWLGGSQSALHWSHLTGWLELGWVQCVSGGMCHAILELPGAGKLELVWASGLGHVGAALAAWPVCLDTSTVRTVKVSGR